MPRPRDPRLLGPRTTLRFTAEEQSRLDESLAQDRARDPRATVRDTVGRCIIIAHRRQGLDVLHERDVEIQALREENEALRAQVLVQERELERLRAKQNAKEATQQAFYARRLRDAHLQVQLDDLVTAEAAGKPAVAQFPILTQARKKIGDGSWQGLRQVIQEVQ